MCRSTIYGIRKLLFGFSRNRFIKGNIGTATGSRAGKQLKCRRLSGTRKRSDLERPAGEEPIPRNKLLFSRLSHTRLRLDRLADYTAQLKRAKVCAYS
jgi:hypothetical protein